MKISHHQDKWMRYEDDIWQYYYPQLKEWLGKGKDRKPAQVAFTAGLARWIANLVEDAEEKVRKEKNG